MSSTATFTVQRDAGTFTEVMVDWQVTALNASSDVNPTTGSVTFSEGQITGIFTITALEDEVIKNIISIISFSSEKVVWLLLYYQTR